MRDEIRRASPLERFEASCSKYIVAPSDLPRLVLPVVDGPERSGVYFLWGEDDALLYVGASGSIITRMAQHRWAGRIPFVAFSVLDVYINDGFPWHEFVESAYIFALDPPLNTLRRRFQFKGEQAMQDAIAAAWRQS